MNTQRIIEYLDNNQLLAWSLFYSKEKYSKFASVLKFSNDFCFQFFSLLTLFLNACLCIDLYLTLKSPFKSPKVRMILFYVFSIVLCIPLTLLTMNSFEEITEDESKQE